MKPNDPANAMKPEQFTQERTVFETVERMKELMKERIVSDIIDDAGNQYVDLVMEGGGVLGIALVGYTYALEQAGIRFLGIGGTSAGSINALLMAALGVKEAPKSEKVIGALANKNLRDFVDGDGDAQDFVDTMLAKSGLLKIMFKASQIIDNLNNNLGLNPGDQFLQWLSGLLEKEGISTAQELTARMHAVPAGFRRREETGPELTETQKKPRLALITAEVTTETKVEFPKMAGLFWENSEQVNPALFVRASMSIPFFFHPFRVAGIPQGPPAFDLWEEHASYGGTLPTDCLFMDGGIMSNFPISSFHKFGTVPAAPTFGVKLGTDRTAPHSVQKPGHLAGAIFNSARHCLDYDFITNNPDYRQLVSCIDTGDHHWLNFSLTDEAKLDLFRRGVVAAESFLTRFDWAKYKETRRHLAGAAGAATQ